MKKVLFMLSAMVVCSSLAFAYNYNTNVPLPGGSLADGKLQTEMLFPVYAYGLRIAAPECKDFAIVDTSVSQAKKDGKWSEVWTVKACERVARIPINFTTSEKGTDFAIDPMGVKVAK